MRIAEYKQIDTKIVPEEIYHAAEYDADGNLAADAYTETVDVEVPVMGMVYRDATAEEIAEAEQMQAEMPKPEPTAEEQLADLAEYVNVLTEMLLGGGE